MVSKNMHKFTFNTWAKHFSFLFPFLEQNIPNLSRKVTWKGVFPFSYPVTWRMEWEGTVESRDHRRLNVPELNVLAMPGEISVLSP